jgi:hypothetical protein
MASKAKPKKTEQYTLLRAIYVVFLGLIIALFVGLGIAAFYETPKRPEQSSLAQETNYAKEPTPQAIEAQKAFENQIKEYEENKLGPYNRNVSIITLVIAVVILTVGLLFSGRFLVLSDGILLGGVFTLLYSIIRATMANNIRFTFIVVAVSLAVTLFLGFWKFLRRPKK